MSPIITTMSAPAGRGRRVKAPTVTGAQYVAPDWDELRNFEFGVNGDQAQNATQGIAVSRNITRNLISTTRSVSGTRSCEMVAVSGDNDFGGFAVDFPTHALKGDHIWFQHQIWVPANPTFIISAGASGSLKYMRIRQTLANGTVTGHFDLQFVNDDVGQTNQFRMLKEGQGVWERFGDPNAFPRGEWVTHTCYMKLDDQLPSEGGTSRIMFWQNGVLLVDSASTRTIINATDECIFYLITDAWNGGAPQNQSWWIDDIRVAKNGRPTWVLDHEDVP